ncbi:hypothetical protein V5799_006849 [Amblyomma americanum]|uniref:Uncharacterized protein n=1 Tax=Amblyomma americanum TaxID=6943 RepID=A0AAQ4DV85_AMBAM
MAVVSSRRPGAEAPINCYFLQIAEDGAAKTRDTEKVGAAPYPRRYRGASPSPGLLIGDGGSVIVLLEARTGTNPDGKGLSAESPLSTTSGLGGNGKFVS